MFHLRTVSRALLALALAGMLSGCFRPLYGDRERLGGHSVVDAMRSVQVDAVKLVDNRAARVGVELRNQVIFDLTGGGEANTASYRLIINLNTRNQSIVIDPATGRSDNMISGIDCSYRLEEIGTGKQLFTASTFASVSYDIPGQEQRFAAVRAVRDAEDRASGVVAEAIRSRLASYFAAGA